MKKLHKFILPLVLALVMIFTVAGAALADDLDVDIDINAEESGFVGDTATVTATVTVTAVDTVDDWWEFYTGAASSSGYTFTAPDGTIVDLDLDSLVDYGWFWNPADASYSYTWEVEVPLSQLGAYDLAFWGDAQTFDFDWWGPYVDEETFLEKSAKIVAYMRYIHQWYDNGQFELVITDFDTSHRSYPLAPVSVDTTVFTAAGLAIVPDITQFGACLNGSQILRVDIPAGTIVVDENGDPVTKVMIIYNNWCGLPNGPYFEILNGDKPGSQAGTAIYFSQPVVISKELGGGGYQEIVTFDHVIDGILVP